MFAFLIDPGSTVSVLDLTGLELEKNATNNYDVVNLTYMGAAEKKGIEFYDEVTHMEISSIDRPKKEYIYIFGILLLSLVLYSQKKQLSFNKKY